MLKGVVGILLCASISAQYIVTPDDEADPLAAHTEKDEANSVEILGENYNVASLATEGFELSGRSEWIKDNLSRVVLPRVEFEEEPLHECLEYLRRMTAIMLSHDRKKNTHIHFLKLSYDRSPNPITFNSEDVSVREVLELITKKYKFKIIYTDYGVVIDASAANVVEGDDPFSDL